MRKILTALALGACMAAAPAGAQTFPNKPITIVVPFPAGGAVDALVRPVADFLATRYKVAVLVDNKTGAGGNIGTAFVARSAPDGYTLVAGTVGTHVLNGLLSPNIGYDGTRSFLPLTANAIVPNVLLAGPALQARTVAELIAYAKQNPKKVDYASAGIGSPSHLAGELLAAQAGIELVHVPYKGAPPVVSDLVSGRLAIFFNNLPSSMPLLQDGKVRALAVTTPTRAPALEQVPTMKEAGLPDFEVVTWYGLFAPAGTPAPVVDMLSRDIREALRSPAISAAYRAQGAIVVGNSPAEFAALVAKDRDYWSEVIRRAGIKVE